jgi:transcription initiation factor IIE alpha subunit
MSSKWKDDFYVDAYNHAKAGMGDMKIAEALGMSYKTFRKWLKRKPALKNALIKARKMEKRSGVKEYKDYVYDRLPRELKNLWDRLVETETLKNPIEYVESLFEGKGKRTRQMLFLNALVHCNFNPSDAMKMVGITKPTLDRWVTAEPQFAELLAEVNYHKKNFFEGALVQAAKAGEWGAILHGNKVYNADRGHNTKTIMEHQGKVQHEHSVSDLGLETKELRTILDAIRKRNLATVPYQDDRGEEIEDAEFTVRKKKKKGAIEE